jgi:hypothetical protein
MWTHLLFSMKKEKSVKNAFCNISTLSISLSAIFFLIHPLNAEVIGWLSASSYTIALSFSLLSCICTTRIVVSIYQDEQLHDSKYNELGSVLFYIMACFSKAPAVMLPAITFLALVLLLISHVFVESNENKKKRLTNYIVRHFIFFVSAGGIILYFIFNSNKHGTSNSFLTNNNYESCIIRALVRKINIL